VDSLCPEDKIIMSNTSFNWKLMTFWSAVISFSLGYIYWLYFYVYPYDFLNPIGFEHYASKLFEYIEPGLPKDYSWSLFEIFNFSSVQYRWLQIFLMLFVLILAVSLLVILSGSLLLGIVLLDFIIISPGFFYDGTLFYGPNVYCILVLSALFLVFMSSEDYFRVTKSKNFFLGMLVGLFFLVKLQSTLVLCVFILLAKWRGLILSNNLPKKTSLAFFLPLVLVLFLRFFIEANTLEFSSFVNLEKFFNAYPFLIKIILISFFNIYSPFMYINFIAIFLGFWGVAKLSRIEKDNHKEVNNLKNLGHITILGLALFVEEFSKSAFSLLLPYLFFLFLCFLGISFLRKDESVKRILDPLLISCVIASLLLNFNSLELKRNIWKDEITINEVSRFSQVWNEPIFSTVKVCDPSYIMDFLPQKNMCSGGLKLFKGKLIYDEREWPKSLFENKEELPSLIFMGKPFQKYLVANKRMSFGETLRKFLFYNYYPINFKPGVVWVRKDKQELFSLVKEKQNNNVLS
jgi:hypothetical protein